MDANTIILIILTLCVVLVVAAYALGYSMAVQRAPYTSSPDRMSSTLSVVART